MLWWCRHSSGEGDRLSEGCSLRLSLDMVKTMFRGKMFLFLLGKSRQLEGRTADFCRKTSQSSEVSDTASVFSFPAEIALPSSGNGITNTSCSCCELAPSLSQLNPSAPCRSFARVQVSLV